MRIVVAAVAFVLGAALLGGCHCGGGSGGRTVRVAAASDLARAFEELGQEFEQKTGIHPVFDFGSSGLLAKQIEQGAPYFLFAAANKSYIEQVVKAGRCDASTAKLYARGRIVVWTPADGVKAPDKLDDLADARFTKIAIANPDHAPYGVAAKQALEKIGIWAKVEPHVVLAENVQATMLYARDHNADAAIVALSLATITNGGTSLNIDPTLHDALDQQLVVCGQGADADAARQLAEFINSREVMTRYGFLLPDEKLPVRAGAAGPGAAGAR